MKKVVLKDKDNITQWVKFVKKYPKEAKLMQNLFIDDYIMWANNFYKEMCEIPHGKEVYFELKRRAQRF